MGVSDREWFGGQRKDDEPKSALAGRPSENVSSVAAWLASAQPTADSKAAIAAWVQELSIPALLSKRLMWALCLAFAAPVFARLGFRAHAWCFHGQACAGRDDLLSIAASMYAGPPGEHLDWASMARRSGAVHQDGLLVFLPPGETDSSLDRALVAAKLWLDGVERNEQEPARGLALFASEERFDPRLVRAKWGNGKLWVFDVPADAGFGEGIFEGRPAHGVASSALMVVRALRTGGQIGVSWLRYLNWWGSDLPQAFLQTPPSAIAAGVAPGTNLTAADVAQCFAIVAACGEYATAEGLTGWPAGAATEAGMAMMKAWEASNLSLLRKRARGDAA